MNFGTNLSAARRAKGMSQEELAERLGVSRQTIYKWEMGITFPDIDKLYDIAKHLEVSASELLGEAQASAEPAAATPVGDKVAVLRHFRAFANVIGACTLGILLGVAAFIAMGGLGGEGLKIAGLLVLLGMIFAGVIGYVVAGLKHEAFQKENGITVVFSKEERAREQHVFMIKIITALSLIFVGVFLVIAAAMIDRSPFGVLSVSALLALVGAACYLFITAGILHELYEGGEHFSHAKKEKNPLEEALSGAIMTVATVAFLVLGFVFGLWHPAWVAFPIGMLLCGLLSSVFKVCRKSEAQDDLDKDEEDV